MLSLLLAGELGKSCMTPLGRAPEMHAHSPWLLPTHLCPGLILLCVLSSGMSPSKSPNPGDPTPSTLVEVFESDDGLHAQDGRKKVCSVPQVRVSKQVGNIWKS